MDNIRAGAKSTYSTEINPVSMEELRILMNRPVENGWLEHVLGTIASGRDPEKVRALAGCSDRSDETHSYLVISR